MSEQTYRKKSRPSSVSPQRCCSKAPLSSVALNLCGTGGFPKTATCGFSTAASAAAASATDVQDIGNNNFESIAKARQRLTEEHLKTNVQIVLTNIHRNYNALRSVTLNEKPLQSSLVDSLNCKLIDHNKMTSPEADYNSNPHYAVNQLQCSVASSQDFTHDNSDYQWFLDYGYREGVPHQSILSSLSASYNGIGELSYYEDLAKNIDVNVAEVDFMESFRPEDINTLLNLPSSRKRRPENEFDTSICKSELLFSPVKESHISVDSLDMDGYPNEDIILTCKANKDNYTIAFEGSIAYSEEGSYYADTRRHHKIDEVVRKKALESLSRSDTGFTTWSKLKKAASSQLQRYPSGNNNTSVNHAPRHNSHCILRKSSSMPSLHPPHVNPLNVSQVTSNSVVNGRVPRVVFPMPVSSETDSENQAPLQSSSNTSNNEHVPNQPSFSLVKLFIKQKSNSTDTCMDVSSGCWPSDSSSSAEQNRVRKRSMNDSGKCSALSRHDEEVDDDSGSCHYDSLDVHVNMVDNKVTNERPRSNDLYKEVFDSPSRRNYKECNLNIRTQPKHPVIFNLNNNNSLEANKSLTDTSRTSENLTQIYNKTRIPLDMITRSIQTSVVVPPLKERVRVVPPSFLAQLNRHEKKTAPVYVIYPNYTLPNLDFLEMQNEVILSPLEFPATKRPRPKSLADIENIAAGKYNHILDWKSLYLLLPKEYRRMLRNIPEVEDDVDDFDVDMTSQKPLYSMTPPLRRSSRPLSCDCASYVQGTCTSSSSNSSTNQPPSSGYRGSSTLLTDSELDNNNDNMRNMYVYQYDNNKIESDVERPPTGRGGMKGILRRGASQPKPRYKRNSMIEEEQRAQVEKRRSLQDIPYYEDFPEEYDTVDQRLPYRSRPLYTGYNNIDPNNHRLPHPKQYYDCNAVKLNKTNYNYMTELNDLELNRALSSGRLSQTPPFTSPQKDPDADARSRAENFLSNVPKSELKYYAEVANILESIENVTEPYDRLKLRNEVSRALVQKRVSFNPPNNGNVVNNNLLAAGGVKPFTTPPNSPNISMAMPRGAKGVAVSEKEKQEKIQSNRFKRLQIQWELLSKDSQSLMKDMKENKLETKSGGSTPTSAPKSRIPRPVSYPTAKPLQTENKALRSPSRIVPPKKYTTTSPITAPAVTPRTTTTRLHGTPKRTPTPRVPTRTR